MVVTIKNRRKKYTTVNLWSKRPILAYVNWHLFNVHLKTNWNWIISTKYDQIGAFLDVELKSKHSLIRIWWKFELYLFFVLIYFSSSSNPNLDFFWGCFFSPEFGLIMQILLLSSICLLLLLLLSWPIPPPLFAKYTFKSTTQPYKWKFVLKV